ncbi:molybdopterin molybdenumtransferase MoeA [Robertmurraya yapensis]|uniref:Molybdopterin molybdenumtransferase n=1 Tax=Bacillus yapensis TaxID=2492960 RepID=A0A431WCL8_9BACI|nr:gephyrin-like molybdotransferase Glp [Bacillus yapensis]RTR33058.1 molybdopterin molybdenumtransferase MoeA [Bacillus yapensis]TKS96881.1 molybdopterin molybdotransferase MoeA [Bacillus yapensis]
MKFFQVKSVEETFQLIQEMVTPIRETMTLPLFDALHFVLAEDIIVRENVPNFRRSSVDGYAVKAKDTFGSSETMPGFLTVTGEVKMGQEPPKEVGSGEAMYVPTGGMLPAGSDAMVMIEHCEDISGLLNVYRQTAPGENVISIGEDMQAGTVLLTKGTKLRSQEIGALASQGILEVRVWKKPVIGYLSSGDEIVPMESKDLLIGEVRDINAATIGSLVKQWGLGFIYGGIVKDSREELERRTKEMLEKTDCLILSGGSSVGTKDYSVEVIESLGEPGVYVHGVSIKPGKPTILAQAKDKPVIGLPGHPASAMIIFHLFGKAVVDKLQGLSETRTKLTFAKVTKNIPSAPGRTDYIRVRLFEENHEWYAEPILGKSGLISTLVKSEGMIEISYESEGVHKGEQVPVTLFL